AYYKTLSTSYRRSIYGNICREYELSGVSHDFQLPVTIHRIPASPLPTKQNNQPPGKPRY
ncbi:MAG TPA: hypothetical protein PLV30_09795, partial [Candidatus Marinimicrobia bacterium]|nr:hypothetical protein [Candidatus Neomarinimicrobiota bacterium]